MIANLQPTFTYFESHSSKPELDMRQFTKREIDFTLFDARTYSHNESNLDISAISLL